MTTFILMGVAALVILFFVRDNVAKMPGAGGRDGGRARCGARGLTRRGFDGVTVDGTLASSHGDR